MRSLLLRILLASLGTVLASLGAFLITFRAMSGPATERLIRHFQARQIEDALDAFERGGPAEAAAYLDRLNRSLGATHYLTDATGRDVVIGRGSIGAPQRAAAVVRAAAARRPRRRRRLVSRRPPSADHPGPAPVRRLGVRAVLRRSSWPRSPSCAGCSPWAS